MIMERKKPSIFISHSSRDLRVARAVRNLLEDRDHHVLLLGLLQELPDDQIRALLTAEVVAREWLVLIDTDYARQSKWVQFEIEIARQYKRTFHTVAGERFMAATRYEIEEKLRPCIDSFSRSLRIVLSYAHQDKASASLLTQVLGDAGYEFWTDDSIPAGSIWEKVIQQEIDDALERGIFMPIISNASLGSAFVQSELNYAYEQGKGFILPVVIGDFDIDLLPPIIRSYQFFDARHKKSEPGFKGILHTIEIVRHRRLAEQCGAIEILSP